MQEWIDTTAEFLKSLDSHHLLTVGSEGFLGSSTPGKLHCSAAVKSPWQQQQVDCWHGLVKLHVLGCQPLEANDHNRTHIIHRAWTACLQCCMFVG